MTQYLPVKLIKVMLALILIGPIAASASSLSSLFSPTNTTMDSLTKKVCLVGNKENKADSATLYNAAQNCGTVVTKDVTTNSLKVKSNNNNIDLKLAECIANQIKLATPTKSAKVVIKSENDTCD